MLKNTLNDLAKGEKIRKLSVAMTITIIVSSTNQKSVHQTWRLMQSLEKWVEVHGECRAAAATGEGE